MTFYAIKNYVSQLDVESGAKGKWSRQCLSEQSILGKVDGARKQGNEEKMTELHLWGLLGFGLVISVSIKETVIEEEEIMWLGVVKSAPSVGVARETALNDDKKVGNIKRSDKRGSKSSLSLRKRSKYLRALIKELFIHECLHQAPWHLVQFSTSFSVSVTCPPSLVTLSIQAPSIVFLAIEIGIFLSSKIHHFSIGSECLSNSFVRTGEGG
jgi:hypothetical protein